MPAHCDATNASALLATKRPPGQAFSFSVGEAAYVGIDGSTPRFALDRTDLEACGLNFELSDAKIQPLSGSKIGAADADGTCRLALTSANSLQLTRGRAATLCGYSAHDAPAFTVPVLVRSSAVWTFSGA